MMARDARIKRGGKVLGNTTYNYNHAFARGRIYKFLSLCFGYPEAGIFAYLKGKEFHKELGRVLHSLPDVDGLKGQVGSTMKSMEESLKRISFQEVESTYISMFVANFPVVPCPPYSSLYTVMDDSKRPEEIIKIKDFYRKYGLDISKDFKDLPDHIYVEMELMHFLCFREAEAWRNEDHKGVKDCLKGEKDFLGDFLGRCISPFWEAVRDKGGNNVFTHLSGLAKDFVLYDEGLLNMMKGY